MIMSTPFRIDGRKVIGTARRKLNNRVDGIKINFPGITFCVKPTDPEQKAAREIAIFLANRRVLNSKECCDHCIDHSLESLQKIREFLVQKQIDLAFATDGALFVMSEFSLEAIRQFLTFHERLEAAAAELPPASKFSDLRRPIDIRNEYFEALELLRGHLHCCFQQIKNIAAVELPKVPDNLRQSWQMESYLLPETAEDCSDAMD
jgi:hypothetical protein